MKMKSHLFSKNKTSHNYHNVDLVGQVFDLRLYTSRWLNWLLRKILIVETAKEGIQLRFIWQVQTSSLFKETILINYLIIMICSKCVSLYVGLKGIAAFNLVFLFNLVFFIFFPIIHVSGIQSSGRGGVFVG